MFDIKVVFLHALYPVLGAYTLNIFSARPLILEIPEMNFHWSTIGICTTHLFKPTMNIAWNKTIQGHHSPKSSHSTNLASPGEINGRQNFPCKIIWSELQYNVSCLVCLLRYILPLNVWSIYELSRLSQQYLHMHSGKNSFHLKQKVKNEHRLDCAKMVW